MTTNLESKKSAEPRDRAQSNTASVGAARETTGHTKPEGLEAGEPMADTAMRASATTSNAARLAGELGWGAVLRGMRSLTEVQAHFAEASLDQGRRALDIALRVADTYRDATERTADRVQALTESCTNVGRGLQDWQQECFAQLRRSAEHLSAGQMDFSRCRSPAEFMKIQRDIYLGTINHLLQANAAIFDVASKTAQDTATSLQGREAVSA
jgi:Phasin protein